MISIFPGDLRNVSDLIKSFGINKDDEGWRLEDLKSKGAEIKIIGEYKQDKNIYLLCEVFSNVLGLFSPYSYFPTVPSKPFYNSYTSRQMKSPITTGDTTNSNMVK